jgi:penicillin-binding protein 2
MAVMMATLANGGTRVIPHLVKAVDEGNGWQTVPPPTNPFPPFLFKKGTIAAIHDGLWMAVNQAGTAGRARIPGRDVAGKTGTAQVISLQGRERAGRTEKDLRDHGWFVFMVPRDNPELAGVVFAEHSEHGYLAAPIARHVIETYYAEKEGRPLPTLPAVPGAPLPPATAVAAAVASADKPAPATAARPGGAGGGR